MTGLRPPWPVRLLRWLLRHAGWGLWAAVAGLAALAHAAFLLRCEGFGCTFVGVAWIALAGLWVLAVGVALGVRRLQRTRALPARLSGAALAALLAAGAGHLLYWLVH